MKVLVIGTGGREHALALALSRDPAVTEVHAAPGNPGLKAFATLHDVDQMDGTAVAGLAESVGADLVVIGPEAPLVAGVADAVRDRGISCFGPTREAAELEGSKAFAKDVMAAAGVPTAAAALCTNEAEVAAALDSFGPPYVVKDDGLAAGKGVVVTDDRDAAAAHAAQCDRVVIEEFLDGPEVSLFAITDGSTVYPLQPAQDFKRIFDGDEGPNTGGMGAYTPLPWAPEDLVAEVQARVLQPTVDEMARRGAAFAGLLYAGLALTSQGVRVVEFNARFGDPETQPLMALLDSPLAALLKAAADGNLHEVDPPRWKAGAAVAVVMASAGYPESSSKGDVIIGTETLAREVDVDVIHAGTAERDGALVTAGGRVLAVTAVGKDVADARAKAYEGISSISFQGAQWRTDIAGYVGDDQQDPRSSSRESPMTVPNVLATRYASADLAHVWSPEHKIVLERRLWIAVLAAQKDLGVDVPDGVIADYEAVVEKVDLASIAARERVTRHDVKARMVFFDGPSTRTSSTRPTRASWRRSAERSVTILRRWKRSPATAGSTNRSVSVAASVPGRGEKMNM